MEPTTDTPPSEPLTDEAILAQVTSASPIIERYIYIPDKQFGISVALPHHSVATGIVDVDEAGTSHLRLDMIQVNEALQGKRTGTGTRLLKTFLDEGSKYDVVDMYGHVNSESALRTIARVCGEQSMTFYNHHSGRKLTVSLHDALAQAAQGNRIDYGVLVDLTKSNSTTVQNPTNSS